MNRVRLCVLSSVVVSLLFIIAVILFILVDHTHIDLTCTTDDGFFGICKKPQDCHNEPDKKKSNICGLTLRLQMRCCRITEQPAVELSTFEHFSSTPQQFQSAVQTAQKKCEEYGNTVLVRQNLPTLMESDFDNYLTIDTCARREEALVLGGEEAKPKEFPHMGLVGYGDEEAIQWLCGASLISERFVISAAHCSTLPSKDEAKWINLGELDLSTDMDDADPQIFSIVERIVYPKYSKKLLYNDIALFKLERNVLISAYIRPACLFSQTLPPGTQLIATGWGTTSYDMEVRTLSSASHSRSNLTYQGVTGSPVLMKADVRLVKRETCDEMFQPSREEKLPFGILDSSQLCAGDQLGIDTCKGDSGGPLQISLRSPYCMYGLVAVTSFGKSCGTAYPGVYTRLKPYLPWIVNTVWPDG